MRCMAYYDVAWEVSFHPALDPEFEALALEVQDELLAQAKVIEMFGPALGRPRVDTLNGSRHANMKELRFTAAGGVWRVAFAFDPEREAILLAAGDKSESASDVLQTTRQEGRRALRSTSRRAGREQEDKMTTLTEKNGQALPGSPEQGRGTGRGVDRRGDVATGPAQGSEADASAGRQKTRDQAGERVPHRTAQRPAAVHPQRVRRGHGGPS